MFVNSQYAAIWTQKLALFNHVIFLFLRLVFAGDFAFYVLEESTDSTVRFALEVWKLWPELGLGTCFLLLFWYF